MGFFENFYRKYSRIAKFVNFIFCHSFSSEPAAQSIASLMTLMLLAFILCRISVHKYIQKVLNKLILKWAL